MRLSVISFPDKLANFIVSRSRRYFKPNATGKTKEEYWGGARKASALCWDIFGRIWHGYEIVGLENFPKDGPALIIFYHAAIPVDMIFLPFRIYLKTGRMLHAIGDKFLFILSIYNVFADCFNISTGSVESCVKTLENGGVLCIAPGGTYEAQFGDENYELMWKNRLGFAKVAMEAKVNVIPVFSENVREGYRQTTLFKRIWMGIYENTRFPFVPLYGGFPVKLRTHIGKPIKIRDDDTPESLKDRVASEMQALIAANQRLPGSIPMALLDRFKF